MSLDSEKDSLLLETEALSVNVKIIMSVLNKAHRVTEKMFPSNLLVL